MNPWDPHIILLSPRLQVKAFTLLPLFLAASEQIQVWNQTWNRLLKLVGEGRREGLRSKCYGSLFPSECHCQRVPSHRDVSPPWQLPQGGKGFYWRESPLTPPVSESSVEALGCAFKSLKELNNSWLLVSARSRRSVTVRTHMESVLVPGIVFGDTALSLFNKKKMFLGINPSRSDFPISISEMGQGSSNTLGTPLPRKRLKTKNKQLRGNERKQKQCGEERSSSKTLF